MYIIILTQIPNHVPTVGNHWTINKIIYVSPMFHFVKWTTYVSHSFLDLEKKFKLLFTICAITLAFAMIFHNFSRKISAFIRKDSLVGTSYYEADYFDLWNSMLDSKSTYASFAEFCMFKTFWGGWLDPDNLGKIQGKTILKNIFSQMNQKLRNLYKKNGQKFRNYFTEISLQFYRNLIINYHFNKTYLWNASFHPAFPSVGFLKYYNYRLY